MKPGSFLSWPAIATFLLLAATLAASKVTAHRKAVLLVKPLESIERQIAGFTGIDNPSLSDAVVAQLLPTAYISRTYRKPGLQVDVFIAFYAQQRAGESMHSPKHCLPGAGWEIWNYGSAEIPVDRRSFNVNKYSISREGQRTLTVDCFRLNKRSGDQELLCS